MRVPEGGFASSLDADSEHEEGKFYVWSEAEIDAVLGDRAALFKRFYDVTAGRQLGGSHDPQPHCHCRYWQMPTPNANSPLCRDLLLQARGARVRPGWDDKVLADWNGLMIAAMANAGLVFKRAGLDRNRAAPPSTLSVSR